MATTADFKNGLCIVYNNEIWTIVEFLHVKPGKPRGKRGIYFTSPFSCNITLSVLALDNTVRRLLINPVCLAV